MSRSIFDSPFRSFFFRSFIYNLMSWFILSGLAILLIFMINWVYQTRKDRVLRAKGLSEALELSQKTGKKILNISCGNSDYGDVNADIADRNVKNFVKYDPNKPLPFDDKEFGVVYSAHTIEHTDNPYQFAKELHRVADHVVLLYPHYLDPSAWTLFHRWVNIDGKWIKNPLYSPWVEELVGEMNLWRDPANVKEHARKIGLTEQ